MKLVRILPLFLFAMLVCSGISAQDKTAQPPTPPPPPAPGQMPGAKPGGPQMGGDMMAQHQQLVGEMQAVMARLDESILAMNKAKGEAKVDAMAKVVNELATQQKQSSRDMMQLRMRMITGMQSPGGDMMAQHQKMLEEMKTASERLDNKVKAMNKATGKAKVDAIADALNELVAQHKQSYPDMMRMRMMMIRRPPMPQRMPHGGMPPMPGAKDKPTTGTTPHH